MANESRPRYLTCAETAKLVRGALKRSFPGTTFSVRSDCYSMGASIHVKWTAGPDQRAVEAVCRDFEGQRFDGMTDSSAQRTHYLRPDGAVLLRSSEGSYSYAGYDARDLDGVMSLEGIEPVHFGADYVFCDRREVRA